MTEDRDKLIIFKMIITIIKFLILIGIIIGIPLYLYFFHGETISSLKDTDNLASFADSLGENKTKSAIFYIGVQFLQIVISIIPGQIVQMAGGYLFGLIPGVLLSLTGAALGTSTAYILGKYLGRDAIKLFISPEKTDYYVERLNSKRAYLIVFILYLIPGLPKDVLAYPAGISNMKYKAFLPISLIGRLPAMIASVLIGSFYKTGHYYGAGVIIVVFVIIFALCILFRKQINAYIDRYYEKIQDS